MDTLRSHNLSGVPPDQRPDVLTDLRDIRDRREPSVWLLRR